VLILIAFLLLVSISIIKFYYYFWYFLGLNSPEIKYPLNNWLHLNVSG
jgi:hypothetical protein